MKDARALTTLSFDYDDSCDNCKIVITVVNVKTSILIGNDFDSDNCHNCMKYYN